MYFADIHGQEQTKRELCRSYMAGVVPHARLFVGEDGSGALALAYAYARYINCFEPRGDDACGACRSCRSYDQFASQDLLFLFPIVNVGSRNFCEDELPQWRSFLAQGPYATYGDWLTIEEAETKQLGIFAREGDALLEKLSYNVGQARYRVVLIWLPEKMNEALGNKLLKLTEEPPPHTVILMVTHDEARVLGTLRSRMQAVHLRPLSEDVIAAALEVEEVAAPKMPGSMAAHLAKGNYRRGLDYYRGAEYDASRALTLGYYKRMLRATVNAKPAEMKQLAEELAKLSREEQLSVLAYTAQMVRESYLYNFAMPELLYLDAEEQSIVNYLRSSINKHNVRTLMEELDLATRHIGQNVNSRMVFFDLLLRLTSALAPSYRQLGLR